jgi:hypothetical protein
MESSPGEKEYQYNTKPKKETPSHTSPAELPDLPPSIIKTHYTYAIALKNV